MRNKSRQSQTRKHVITILYQDPHLLVVEKPPGIPTLGDHTGKADLLSLLRGDPRVMRPQIKNDSKKTQRGYSRQARQFGPQHTPQGLFPIHRLDRAVGGAIAFAYSQRSAAGLGKAIKERRVEKTYLAVVEGRPDPAAGQLVHYLVKDDKRNEVSIAEQDEPGAMRASLEYQVRETRDGRSLAQVELHTGRPHQIRVQLATIGHPIVGDDKYGSGDGRIALWAFRLQLNHPVTGKKLRIYSNPPAHAPWAQFNSLSHKPR